MNSAKDVGAWGAAWLRSHRALSEVALVGLTLMAPCSTFAQYRAFELVIKDAATGQERVEVSTLTPVQYRAYYPTKPSETVSYRATWMCRGNTGHHKPVCANPKA